MCLVFCYTRAFQSTSGAAESASPVLRGRNPSTKGALVPHRPLLRRGHCPEQAAWPAVHAPLPAQSRKQACALGSAAPPTHAARYFTSRQRLALGGMNARFCLLSYFIYIF